ncbi:MAG: class I adenylate cyclase [Hahellaceae bacterium]|nr:class I adenylate cyclase [Hahellaceae bacterium]
MRRAIQFDPAEGVDRKDLKTLIQRYLTVTAERLNRTRQALSSRQQIVLDLLPLLFQVNHPLMPGYVSRNTPRGLYQYEPDAKVIQTAQRLSRSFDYRHEKKAATDLVGLFLMGSTGSIAHGSDSDFDVWLCHRGNLEPDARQELEVKAERVSQWAAEQGVEVHIFVINPAEFRHQRKQAEAGQEDCGTSQHYLLLDEFYRTHIWLAGAYPLWWIIPPNLEHRFNDVARDLVQKRFIRGRDFLDFGGCPSIPPGEYVGAGMWQLYKGVDAPYKSVLKLMLIETYAADPGAGPNLSLSYKQAIFEDRLDVDELDPYLMVYRRLEHSLQRREAPDRLLLARKSLYLKVGERLSASQPERNKSWRRRLLEKLIKEWQWAPDMLRFLDARPRWKVDAVIQERRQVVAELTGCYRFLSGYARDQKLESAISARDLHLLGRKLYAAFQRKAGKLELVNPGISPDISEDSLAFVHASASVGASEGGEWWLSRSQTALENPASALRRSASLFELLAWAHLNQILVSGTTLNLTPGQTQARVYELLQLHQVLQAALPVPLPTVEQAIYQDRSRLSRVIVAVNVGVDPMLELSRKGLAKLSDKTDALGYADEKTNLVMQVDLLLANCWNEVLVQHFQTGDTLIQTLKNWLSLLAEGEQWGTQLPVLQVCCFCPTRAPYIAERVRLLMDEITQAFFMAPVLSSDRYLLQMDERYFVLQFVNRQPRFTALDGESGLIEFLGQPQPAYSRLLLDSYALKSHPLRVIAAHQRPGTLQVFYRVLGRDLDVFISDERGSLIAHSIESESADSYLAALAHFIRAVLDRKQMHDVLAEDDEGLIEVEFFRLRPSAEGWSADPDVPNEQAMHDLVEVQVIGEQWQEGRLSYRLFVGHQEFSGKGNEQALLSEVAIHLRQRFRSGVTPRAYITDLSLPGGWTDDEGFGHRQTRYYLYHRFEIEKALRQSIA